MNICIVLTHFWMDHLCITTLVHQATEDCAGSGASEERSHRCICLSATFHGNTREVHIPVYTDKIFCCIQIHCFYRLTFVSPIFTIYEAGTSLDWDDDTKVCLFKCCQKKTVPSHIGLGVMKGQTLLPSLHWVCRMPRLVYPMMILNIVSTNIFFPLGKMIGTVRLRTSFILSSQSWETGSPPTGVAGRMKLSCVVPTSVIHI